MHIISGLIAFDAAHTRTGAIFAVSRAHHFRIDLHSMQQTHAPGPFSPPLVHIICRTPNHGIPNQNPTSKTDADFRIWDLGMVQQWVTPSGRGLACLTPLVVPEYLRACHSECPSLNHPGICFLGWGAAETAKSEHFYQGGHLFCWTRPKKVLNSTLPSRPVRITFVRNWQGHPIRRRRNTLHARGGLQANPPSFLKISALESAWSVLRKEVIRRTPRDSLLEKSGLDSP
jgi:hypothetical protein